MMCRAWWKLNGGDRAPIRSIRTRYATVYGYCILRVKSGKLKANPRNRIKADKLKTRAAITMYRVVMAGLNGSYLKNATMHKMRDGLAMPSLVQYVPARGAGHIARKK